MTPEQVEFMRLRYELKFSRTQWSRADIRRLARTLKKQTDHFDYLVHDAESGHDRIVLKFDTVAQKESMIQVLTEMKTRYENTKAK